MNFLTTKETASWCVAPKALSADGDPQAKVRLATNWKGNGPTPKRK